MENHAKKDFIKVGKIGATYGIKGWLKIRTYTEYGASILEYTPWHLLDAKDHENRTILVEDGRAHGAGIVVKFVGIETPEAARLLTGLTIAITRAQLPPLKEHEYYWSDLEGLSVYNTKNELLGTVSYIMSTGSNDVLVVKGDKEHAIPYLINSVIKKIDLEKREIHVDWELI